MKPNEKFTVLATKSRKMYQYFAQYSNRGPCSMHLNLNKHHSHCWNFSRCVVNNSNSWWGKGNNDGYCLHTNRLFAYCIYNISLKENCSNSNILLGQAEVLPMKLILNNTFIMCDQAIQPKDRCCLPNGPHLVCYNIMWVQWSLFFHFSQSDSRWFRNKNNTHKF